MEKITVNTVYKYDKVIIIMMIYWYSCWSHASEWLL